MAHELKVCIIGAGFAGLCAAIQLQKQLGISSYTIFEKNEDVGGVWLVNKYPGAACDVFFDLYTFSFEQNSTWTSAFASHSKLQEYLRDVATKHGIYRNIQFRTLVQRLTWDADVSKWRVRILNEGGRTQELLFDFVFNGCGQLGVPNIPPEFRSFKGKAMHSAEWDPETSLENKIVAVVGSGASAAQIIPAIAPSVRKLHVFQRKPAWILPKPDYPGWVKKVVTRFPVLARVLRLVIYIFLELTALSFTHGGIWNKFATQWANKFRSAGLSSKPHLIPRCRPSHVFGCNRYVMSNDYYPALCRRNVTVCNDPILEVRNFSIVTENETYDDIDILILATGFKVQDYFAPMEIYGTDGRSLLETWKLTRPCLYYGMLSSIAPNLFTLAGPSSYLGHNSIIFQIECQTNFNIKLIKELLRRKARTVCLKPEAEKEYLENIKKKLKGTVWESEDCGSWYTNSQGEVTSLWPQTCTAFWYQTRNIDIDRLDFT